MRFLGKMMASTRAPEFPADLEWLQGGPLGMRVLRGKVVLVDFFTYSCVNCLRTLPHVKRWHALYAKHGLQIIGIHTPEFMFEQKRENVGRAAHDLGIPYPIVLDSAYTMWQLYANRYWPHHYLIDHRGVIVYDHIGEGGYAKTELMIQEALMAIGAKDLPAIGPDDSVGGAVCYRTSPEIYLGYFRGKFGNASGFSHEHGSVFTDLSREKDEDLPYLHGHWEVAAEYVAHDKTVPSFNEYLAIKYKGFGVNVVAESATGKGVEVEVTLNSLPLSDDFVGEDIRRTPQGRTVMLVREPKMYKVVNAAMHHKGVLKFAVADAGFRAYAFTFAGCSEE